MSMKHLAELSGVSVSTVSKAFSGSKEISDEKRQEIFKLAKKYGYYDKYICKYRKGPLIAVICPEFKSRNYSDLLSFMDEDIHKRGGTMIASSSDFDKERTVQLMDFYANTLKVDGIILYSSGTEKKFNIPVVVIGTNDVYTSVSLSNKNAIFDAVKHFAENGHRNIAFIGENLTQSSKVLFDNAMRENGIEIKKEYEIVSTLRFEEAGYETMNKLFECETQPTAVLAAYDNIALGAIKSIYEHGKKIPDDISVIGMNDNAESKFLEVPLTSITEYKEDLCEIVVETLFAQICGRKKTNKQIKLSTELVKRGSVGKVKKEI